MWMTILFKSRSCRPNIKYIAIIIIIIIISPQSCRPSCIAVLRDRCVYMTCVVGRAVCLGYIKVNIIIIIILLLTDLHVLMSCTGVWMVISSSLFSGGPQSASLFHAIAYLHVFSALYLSKRSLKQFTVGAITTCWGRLFHMLTTLLLKKLFHITEFYYFDLPVSNCFLKLSNWVIHTVEVDLSSHFFKFHDYSKRFNTRKSRMYATATIAKSGYFVCLLGLVVIDRVAGEIIRLVASVCVSVRLSVGAHLFEPFDPWPWFLAWGSALTLASLGL